MTMLQRTPARPFGMGVRWPADGQVLLSVGVAALLTDLAVRSGVAGAAGTLLVVAVAVAVVLSGRVARTGLPGRVTGPPSVDGRPVSAGRTGLPGRSPGAQAVGVVAAAVPFCICLSVRMSPWLLPLDILAIGGLLVLGASLAGGGSLLDLPIPTLVVRGLHALGHGLGAPAYVVAPLRRRRPFAVLRGIGLALPLLVVLGLLLASADAVFAGFFEWGSPVTVIAHAVLLGIGAWGMAGLLRLTAADPPPEAPALPYRLGHVEATVVLGSLVALFAAFAVAQVVAIAGGARHVLGTAGLTYAQYARTGFFQLLAVAAITLVAIVGLRAVTDLSDPGRQRQFTILAEVAIALTLVVVAVALRRLGLYQHAYGLTMLRLYSSVFAVWIGVVLVLAGCGLAGVAAGRAWFPGAAGVVGLALLLGLNIANPEAVVVRQNVDRATKTQKVDPDYLAALSDDAVPALVAALPRLPEPARTQVLAAICDVPVPPFDGWAAANTSRRRAMVARRQVCRPVGLRR